MQFELEFVPNLLIVFVVDEHKKVQFQANVHVIDHICDIILRHSIIKKKNTNLKKK